MPPFSRDEGVWGPLGWARGGPGAPKIPHRPGGDRPAGSQLHSPHTLLVACLVQVAKTTGSVRERLCPDPGHETTKGSKNKCGRGPILAAGPCVLLSPSQACPPCSPAA